MLFGNFKNYHILRYVIYEFLKKVLGGPRPTCLVRVHCAVNGAKGEAELTMSLHYSSKGGVWPVYTGKGQS